MMLRPHPAYSLAATLCLVPLVTGLLNAQVTPARLLDAESEPQNWLTYSGTYMSQRHSTLGQITPNNAGDLELNWVFQAQSLHTFESTPLVVDGIMYLTQAPNDVVALDARSGGIFWIYRYPEPEQPVRVCCGRVNRGLAIHGNTLFMGTVDAHLLAIDAKSGKPIWNTKVAESSLGYSITVAPLVVKNLVIVGISGGEYGIRGFVAAYDVLTGAQVWRFQVVPEPGVPGNETWLGDSWMHGGGATWVTGSYDPELNLLYWGTGNPGPDYNPHVRRGDNLYTDCVVALDVDTGELKWHFQFTPNDAYDYDATQIPVLVDGMWGGRPRKLMYWANRNGFFYVLDRTDGEFLFGTPFVKVNWASGLDRTGRPIQTPQPPGEETYPGVAGGTNWFSPSFSPITGLFYVSVWENYRNVFQSEAVEYREGQPFLGGRGASPIPGIPNIPTLHRGPINTWTEELGTGAVLALDPTTGEERWRFEMTDVTDSGLLTTAADVLFAGGREGYFHAFDASSGKLLWKAALGGPISSGPITYMVGSKQYVGIAAGHSYFVFGLRDREDSDATPPSR